MNQLSVYLFSREGSFLGVYWGKWENEEVFVIIYAFSMRSICNQRVINSLLLQSEHKQSQHGKLMWLKIWNFIFIAPEAKIFIVFICLLAKGIFTFTNRKNLNTKRWCLLCNVQAIKREWHISIPITPFLQEKKVNKNCIEILIFIIIFSAVFNKAKIISQIQEVVTLPWSKITFIFPTHTHKHTHPQGKRWSASW